jgi:hypothetical protein
MNTHIPIIFLTAKTQTEDVLKGFETGGNDYLRKPFSMEELIVRITNLVHMMKPQEGATDVYVLGVYTFLPNRYELKYNDSVRKLSHREASLLKIFCDNRNKTVSRKRFCLRCGVMILFLIRVTWMCTSLNSVITSGKIRPYNSLPSKESGITLPTGNWNLSPLKPGVRW